MTAPSAQAIAEKRLAFPRAFGPSPLARAAASAALLLFSAYLVWVAGRLGFEADRLLEGADRLGTIVVQMWPPRSGGFLRPILLAIVETVAMALIGTLIAVVLAFPLGFLGAKTVLSNRVAHFALRRAFDIFRGVPTLIWALIFVRATGLGPMAGILAMAASDFAALAKLNAEAIENVDRKPVEGVLATGASAIEASRLGVLTQVLPVMTSQALYAFESNIRSAAILGLVGAGGIGFELQTRIRINQWDQVAFIILLFLLVVAAIDWLSERLRARMIR
jgi:phosphonate transport system permease protein